MKKLTLILFGAFLSLSAWAANPPVPTWEDFLEIRFAPKLWAGEENTHKSFFIVEKSDKDTFRFKECRPSLYGKEINCELTGKKAGYSKEKVFGAILPTEKDMIESSLVFHEYNQKLSSIEDDAKNISTVDYTYEAIEGAGAFILSQVIYYQWHDFYKASGWGLSSLLLTTITKFLSFSGRGFYNQYQLNELSVEHSRLKAEVEKLSYVFNPSANLIFLFVIDFGTFRDSIFKL